MRDEASWARRRVELGYSIVEVRHLDGVRQRKKGNLIIRLNRLEECHLNYEL